MDVVELKNIMNKPTNYIAFELQFTAAMVAKRVTS